MVALLAFVLGWCAQEIFRPASKLHTAEFLRTSIQISCLDRPSEPDNRSPIKRTVDSLNCIHVDDGDDGVPPDAIPLIKRLKHELRERVEMQVTSFNPDTTSAEELNERIVESLRKEGVNVNEPEDVVIDESYTYPGFDYGQIYSIDVRKWGPDVLSVTTEIAVCCGSDTSLYVFQRIDGRWILVLEQESNDYSDVAGAQGTFSFAISKPDKRNSFFVVTANINPWCTSNWQSIRYKVLRPGASPSEPRVLVSNEDNIYQGKEPPYYKLELRSNVVLLTFDGNKKADCVTEGRECDNDFEHIRYRIRGNRAVRLADR
jgi:hypothetical protein